jgi:hypothetical protein
MEGLCSTSIDKASDSELVAATKFGNPEAFERLFARHGRRVLTVAQRILNNREDAEDVLQESFHKAFTHMNTFQEKSRFSTWLTRIAMNAKGEGSSKFRMRILTMVECPRPRHSSTKVQIRNNPVGTGSGRDS